MMSSDNQGCASTLVFVLKLASRSNNSFHLSFCIYFIAASNYCDGIYSSWQKMDLQWCTFNMITAITYSPILFLVLLTFSTFWIVGLMLHLFTWYLNDLYRPLSPHIEPLQKSTQCVGKMVIECLNYVKYNVWYVHRTIRGTYYRS
jgi:hypothetical protein